MKSSPLALHVILSTILQAVPILAAHPSDTLQLVVPSRVNDITPDTTVAAGAVYKAELLTNISISYVLPNGTQQGLIDTTGGCGTDGSRFSAPFRTPLVGNYTIFWNVTYLYSKNIDVCGGPPPYTTESWLLNFTFTVTSDSKPKPTSTGTDSTSQTPLPTDAQFTITTRLPSEPTGLVSGDIRARQLSIKIFIMGLLLALYCGSMLRE